MKHLLLLALVFSLLFSSCAPATQPPEPTDTPTGTPSPTATATITLTPTPTIPDVVWEMQQRGIPNFSYDAASNQVKIKTAVWEISVAPEDVVHLDSGEYVVKKGGKNIAIFDPANLIPRWVFLSPDVLPIKVIKQFEVCDADHWKECYVPPVDLFNGDYLGWLESSWNPNLPLPDPNKHIAIKGDWDVFLTGPKVGISEEDRPFAIGFSYAYTTCDVTWGNAQHERHCVVVPIAMSVPGKLGETVKLIGVEQQAYNETDSEVAASLKRLQKSGKLMLGNFKFDSKTGAVVVSGDSIDVVEQTIKNYPDICDRFANYATTLDPSSLSGSGLILQIFFVLD